MDFFLIRQLGFMASALCHSLLRYTIGQRTLEPGSACYGIFIIDDGQ